MTDATDNVERMNEYRDLQELTRNLRQNALRADDVVDNVRWIAAGGRGTGNLTELSELAEALRQSAEDLEELVEEAPDPREVRAPNYGGEDGV